MVCRGQREGLEEGEKGKGWVVLFAGPLEVDPESVVASCLVEVADKPVSRRRLAGLPAGAEHEVFFLLDEFQHATQPPSWRDHVVLRRCTGARRVEVPWHRPATYHNPGGLVAVG